MDDYALQAELEAMAGNVSVVDAQDDKRTATEPMAATMARWQQLFGLSPDTAIDRIMDHRQDLTRMRVSDEHWETVRQEKESQGHDCESYEYDLELQKKRALLPDAVPAAEGSTVTYLVELGGPLGSPEAVQDAAGLDSPPTEVSGRSVEEGRGVRLCCIDSKAKAAVLRWASENGGSEPTILVDPRSLR